MAQQSGNSRLKVTVRIQENLQTARIEVRGSVTRDNLRALYVVARRTSAMLPGREIVLDLTHARAAVEAILELHDPDQLLRVIGAADDEVPCRLRVLDPITARDTKESV